MVDDFGDGVVVSFPEHDAPFIDDGEELREQGTVYVFSVFDNQDSVESERLAGLILNFEKKAPCGGLTLEIELDRDFKNLYRITQSTGYGWSKDRHVVRIIENQLWVGKFVVPVEIALRNAKLSYQARSVVMHKNELLAPLSDSSLLHNTSSGSNVIRYEVGSKS